MNEKEQAEIYIRLYEIQIALFHKRVDVEWKVFISAITVFILTTGYLAPRINVTPSLIVIFTLTGLLYVVAWAYGLWRANEIDKRWAAVYRSHAEMLLGQRQESLQFRKPRFKEFLRDWSMIGQIVIIALVLFIGLWIIHLI